jgi:cytochrome oxidase Cu insertion factor (SCO1/SenC/PrrC family)
MKRLLLALILGLTIANPAAFGQPAAKEATNSSATDLNRIKVGQPAPDFTLEDSDGKNISLSDYRGKKNVVLVFYRGYW